MGLALSSLANYILPTVMSMTGLGLALGLLLLNRRKRKNLVINWHFLRSCNYNCKFCFHTAKTSHVVSLEQARKGLRKLYQKGMTRINLSGGEPFLKPKFLGQVCEFCHSELNIRVSIVSNGSKIKKSWLKKYGDFVDVLAISWDSFNENTLKTIGRMEKKKGRHTKQLKRISSWCKEYNIKFKINTVLCSANKNETMVKEIKELNPCRWKVFQCLLIHGENAGEGAIRDAKEMVVSRKEFDDFIKRHKEIKCLVPENNECMRNSYLILDEYMCFLNNTEGDKRQTVNILDNTEEALTDSGFDSTRFKNRTGEWCTSNLEW